MSYSFLLPHGQHIVILEHELHPVDELPCVVVAAVPFSVTDPLLNLIQPVLRGLIYGALVNKAKEGFYRLMFARAGVRQNNIYVVPNRGQLFLDPCLDFGGRLFVRPPAVALFQPVELVHAVSAADYDAAEAVQLVNLAVDGKEQVGVILNNATSK